MIKLHVTNTYTMVETTKEGQAVVRDSMRYMVKGGRAAIKRVEKRTGRRWDGYKSMHNRRSKMFPTVLTPKVIESLRFDGFAYEVIDDMKRPEKKPIFTSVRRYHHCGVRRFCIGLLP